MNRPRIGRVVPAVVALALVILVSGGVAAAAGAPGNPFDQVLAKLDVIARMVKPTQPGPGQPVKLASSSLYIGTAIEINCVVANVGTETVVVNPEIFDFRGNRIGHLGTVFLPPGASDGAVAVFDGGSLTARCEVTTDQPAAVRASLQLVQPNYSIVVGELR